MDLLAYFDAEARKAEDRAREIVAAADLEGRRVTEDEQAKYKSELATVQRYKDDAQAERDKRAMKADLETLVGVADDMRVPSGTPLTTEAPIPGDIGTAFVKSGVFKMMAERKAGDRLPEGFKTEAVTLPWRSKAAGMPVLESNNANLFGNLTTTAGSITTIPAGVVNAGFVEVPPAISDLMPSIQVEGNTVTLITVAARDVLRNEITLTGSSWGIGEGSTKNPLGYAFSTSVSVLHKIAAYTKMSEEFLSDAPAAAAYINADMPEQIRQSEDYYLAQVLWASVADAGALGGGTTDADDIQAAILAVRVAGYEPNAMVISPTNWAELMVEKFGSGAGDKQYVGGGPFAPTGNPWGLRVVVSPFALADHPLVGDFSKARVYRKGGLSVQSTNSDQDDFIKNLITIRAESRLVANKEHPAAFKTANFG